MINPIKKKEHADIFLRILLKYYNNMSIKLKIHTIKANFNEKFATPFNLLLIDNKTKERLRVFSFLEAINLIFANRKEINIKIKSNNKYGWTKSDFTRFDPIISEIPITT